MKKTGFELLSMGEILSKYFQVPARKFSYIVDKNASKIASVLKPIEKRAIEYQKEAEYGEFSKIRFELCEKYCDRDEKGVVKQDKQGQFVITHKKFKFDEEIKKLQEKYPNLIKAMEKCKLRYMEDLKAEYEFTVHKIKEVDLFERINVNQRNELRFMLHE